MLGLFNMFGRADGLKALDQAFRTYDVHPRTVSEAVKLATLRLLKKACDADYVLRDADYARAAALLSYCMLGNDQFVASNDLASAEAAGQRLEDAIDAGDSLDAELILLAANAGMLHASIAEQVHIETED